MSFLLSTYSKMGKQSRYIETFYPENRILKNGMNWNFDTLMILRKKYSFQLNIVDKGWGGWSTC